MERNTRIKVAVVVLVVLTLGSVGVASFAYGVQTSAGTYQTGVFAKVNGSNWVWITTAYTWTNVLSLSLPNVPITAYYHVVCDGQVIANGGGFEIAIGFDYWDFWDSATKREYDEGTFGIHTERVYKLGPGAHTFYFKGRKWGSYGVAITAHTITVTVFTDGSVIDLS